MVSLFNFSPGYPFLLRRKPNAQTFTGASTAIRQPVNFISFISFFGSTTSPGFQPFFRLETLSLKISNYRNCMHNTNSSKKSCQPEERLETLSIKF